MAGKLRVTLKKSPISYTAKARGSVRALGLHRIGQTVELDDTPVSRGMARAVRFLVDVEEVQGDARETQRRQRASSARKSRNEGAREQGAEKAR